MNRQPTQASARRGSSAALVRLLFRRTVGVSSGQRAVPLAIEYVWCVAEGACVSGSVVIHSKHTCWLLGAVDVAGGWWFQKNYHFARQDCFLLFS
jgi:hypothetical protein